MKHESNRIAFSLMSYGLESSRAFISQTFARCWWQLGEYWVSCVVIGERKRERHRDRISSQMASSVICIFLEPTRLKEATVPPLFVRHRNAFPDRTAATSFMCHSRDFEIFEDSFRSSGWKPGTGDSEHRSECDRTESEPLPPVSFV